MDVLSGVVPNDQLTDFRPAMLFDIWNSKKNDIRRRGYPFRRREEWAKIDKDGSGSMDSKELRREKLRLFLQTCGEKEPHPDAVAEMLRQISDGTLSSLLGTALTSGHWPRWFPLAPLAASPNPLSKEKKGISV
eukprot:Skav230603  [mRNA]  locus=scaffold168:128086:130384:- [translate_table: standard]